MSEFDRTELVFSTANEVEAVVQCLCASVETALLDQSYRTHTLEKVYSSLRWRLTLEREFEAADQWSLRRNVSARGETLRTDSISEASDLERLLLSVSSESHTRALSGQCRRLLEASSDDDATQAPLQFRLSRLEEVEAETRYCAKGLPQPLRRNVLGERYASPDRPLAYRTRHADATALFRLMRPRVKLELQLRETRRIERLNAQRHKEQQQNADDALEARLDRLFFQSNASVTGPQ